MLLIQPGGKGVGELLLRALIVGAPRFGDASGLLDGDALPALGERTREAGIGEAIWLGLGAEVGNVPLIQRHVLSRQRIQRRYLGVVDGI
jgi:hypothetical protein